MLTVFCRCYYEALNCRMTIISGPFTFRLRKTFSPFYTILCLMKYFLTSSLHVSVTHRHRWFGFFSWSNVDHSEWWFQVCVALWVSLLGWTTTSWLILSTNVRTLDSDSHKVRCTTGFNIVFWRTQLCGKATGRHSSQNMFIRMSFYNVDNFCCIILLTTSLFM